MIYAPCLRIFLQGRPELKAFDTIYEKIIIESLP
jgi:hypothetical protein